MMDNLYILRLDDDQVKYFESLWTIPEGITYNAYVLKTKRGVIVFDTWKREYSDLFISELKKIVDPSEVRYLVVHHMEPDHSGSLKALLEVNPEITVIGHPLVNSMIESFYGVTPKFRPVKDGEELTIGSYRLKFIYTPWLHWPETIMTYLYEHGILFTCDAFGSYSIPPGIYNDELNEDYMKKYRFYTRKYIANIIGYYTGFVIRAIEKLTKLGIDIEVIAPSHGLIWRRSKSIVEHYRLWSSGMNVDGIKKVVVVYSSMYGFVREVIERVIEILNKKGVYYVVYKFLDDSRDEISDILGDLLGASGIIIGTATYDASIFPVIEHVIKLMIKKIPKNKKVLIVTNYGWGGVAGRELKKMLGESGFSVYEVIEFRAGHVSKYEDVIKRTVSEFIEQL